MCAGQDVEIALAARDGYGNAINDLEPDAVKAVASGNETCIKFEPYEVCLSCERLPRAASGLSHPCTVNDIPTQQRLRLPLPTHACIVSSQGPADSMAMICHAFSPCLCFPDRLSCCRPATLGSSTTSGRCSPRPEATSWA